MDLLVKLDLGEKKEIKVSLDQPDPKDPLENEVLLERADKRERWDKKENLGVWEKVEEMVTKDLRETEVNLYGTYSTSGFV